MQSATSFSDAFDSIGRVRERRRAHRDQHETPLPAYVPAPSPLDGETPDYYRFAELGEHGVLVLCSDSTNVDRPGRTRPADVNLRARAGAGGARHVCLAHPSYPAGADPGR